ncbi:isoaspartyl peptidase/L-asparaginase family protein [Novosphingobium cyanobacteriorum]|uniref:Isoaspartyl peptidase/L-asparaginase n=1 Tax=Novosphingobium cyanobacteriorum TaxID=3024215 RepID=A0ABT6CG10_9SPHN|nr:isoaspartyl peptidase/L-asparaginase [Novosphingobium cyanobacteriorum]MDF8332864.1 isoaspartyl peptidase/L-asparaginase [Novosphingobium cyanobacteriorum]
MSETSGKQWAIAIHGGAGSMKRATMDDAGVATHEAALHAALEAGAAVLREGGSAMDAVTASVVALEDDPLFNAGRGAVFTYHGTNELDAAVMDGASRAAGAVAGVTHTRNPVKLARTVMEAGPHVFLAGAGAEEFAREHGVEQVDPDWFATEERWRQLQELKARKLGWFDDGLKYGTVGAVACDAAGHVAAATSTGGLTGKRWNRIGDSPVIGAGTYADDRAGAVSCTGSGEQFMRVGVAHEICARMRLGGESAQGAADAVLAEVGAMRGVGGVIVVTPAGETVFAHTTPGMFRGRADSTGLCEVGIFGE